MCNPHFSSWHGLGNMDSAEAMRLFVKILEVIADESCFSFVYYYLVFR